jgi:hypothetical protein
MGTSSNISKKNGGFMFDYQRVQAKSIPKHPKKSKHVSKKSIPIDRKARGDHSPGYICRILQDSAGLFETKITL